MINTTNNQTVSSNVPTYIAYHVRKNDGGKDFWNRIGAAWAHKSGFNIQLINIPLDGRITLVTAKSKATTATEASE